MHGIIVHPSINQSSTNQPELDRSNHCAPRHRSLHARPANFSAGGSVGRCFLWTLSSHPAISNNGRGATTSLCVFATCHAHTKILSLGLSWGCDQTGRSVGFGGARGHSQSVGGGRRRANQRQAKRSHKTPRAGGRVEAWRQQLLPLVAERRNKRGRRGCVAGRQPKWQQASRHAWRALCSARRGVGMGAGSSVGTGASSRRLVGVWSVGWSRNTRWQCGGDRRRQLLEPAASWPRSLRPLWHFGLVRSIWARWIPKLTPCVAVWGARSIRRDLRGGGSAPHHRGDDLDPSR